MKFFFTSKMFLFYGPPTSVSAFSVSAFRHENGFTIFTLTGIFFASVLELLQGFQTISAWFHVQDVNENQRQFLKLHELADKYPETYG